MMMKAFLVWAFWVVQVGLFGAFTTTSTTQLSRDTRPSSNVQLSSTVQSSYAPDVAMNSSGQAVAVWYRNVVTATSSATTLSNFVIQASVFNGTSWSPNAAATSSPTELTTNTTSAYNPKVAINSSGNAVATWYRNASVVIDGNQVARTIIEASVYNASTGSWSSPSVVSHIIRTSGSSPNANAYNPEVELYDSGLALITYRQVAVSPFGQNTVLQSSNPSITGGGSWSSPVNASTALTSFVQQSFLNEFRQDIGNFQLTQSSSNNSNKAALVWTVNKNVTVTGAANPIQIRVVQAAILDNQ